MHQFQFINAVDVCIVNTFVNGRLLADVSWVEDWYGLFIGYVENPADQVRFLSTQV